MFQTHLDLFKICIVFNLRTGYFILQDKHSDTKENAVYTKLINFSLNFENENKINNLNDKFGYGKILWCYPLPLLS